ncbi:hypothetical protein BGW37DRAFT_503185 [Umbelopsis sp. PMI_123]|nr:hypothetical protein BGW37DRAFT_503185 [Umbelopsis sp. PMI_123]
MLGKSQLDAKFISSSFLPQPHDNMEANHNNPYEVLDNEIPATPDEVEQVAKDEQVHSKFFNRLVSIPVVRDSLSAVYQHLNENSIGRYAFTSTEGTIQRASVIVAPYVERFSDQLKTMDEIGYKSLGYVEENYAIINKPTDQLLADVTEPVRHAKTTARSYIDSTVYVVTRPVDRAAQSLLDNLEYTVDRVLPQNAAEQTEKVEKIPVSQQERAYALVLNTKSRLLSRFTAVEQQIPHSRSEIEQTLKANALLKGAFDHLERLDQTLRQTYVQTTEITKKNLATPLNNQFGTIARHVHENYEVALTFADQRVNNVTSEVVAHVDNTIAFVKNHNHYFPQGVRSHLEPLLSFAGQEYDIVREQVLKTDISSMQKANNVLELSKDYMLPLLQESMDSLHELLRYYQVYADKSTNDALKSFRGQLKSVGGAGIKT